MMKFKSILRYARCVTVTGKGKQVKGNFTHEGPLTSALDWGGWSTPRPGRFSPGKDPVPFVQEAG